MLREQRKPPGQEAGDRQCRGAHNEHRIPFLKPSASTSRLRASDAQADGEGFGSGDRRHRPHRSARREPVSSRSLSSRFATRTIDVSPPRRPAKRLPSPGERYRDLIVDFRKRELAALLLFPIIEPLAMAWRSKPISAFIDHSCNRRRFATMWPTLSNSLIRSIRTTFSAHTGTLVIPREKAARWFRMIVCGS